MKNTEHVHDYIPTYHVVGHSGTAVGLCRCGDQLSLHQLCWRANATERLKAGIDELMDACKDDPKEMGGPFVSLSWVANILEGKDD